MKKPPTPASLSDGHQLDRTTFGKRIRDARKALGWTLQELSAASGVSITTISRAERGLLALGYENFSALARALQLDLGSLFSEPEAAAVPFSEPVVTRAGQGVVYQGQAFDYEFLATSAVGKQMIPVAGVVHAREIKGPADFARHHGEEFVYVISGTLQVHFDNGRTVRLAKGDSLYFDSRIGHAYISVSRELARVVGVITSESGMMRLARDGQAVAPAATPTSAAAPVARTRRPRRS